jgi:hypothetical protein
MPNRMQRQVGVRTECTEISDFQAPARSIVISRERNLPPRIPLTFVGSSKPGSTK